MSHVPEKQREGRRAADRNTAPFRSGGRTDGAFTGKVGKFQEHLGSLRSESSLRLSCSSLNEMVVSLPVLLWVFHVAAVFSQTDFKELQGLTCDSNNSITAEMGYLEPILRKCECQPRETFVKVWHEFPEEMHNTITPHCVPVQRCRGYCIDEATVCVPVKKDTVLVQVLRGIDKIVLPFVRHSACSCRFRNLIGVVCPSTD